MPVQDECEVYLLEKEDFDALLKDSVAERMEDLQSGMADLKTQDNLAGDEVKSEGSLHGNLLQPVFRSSA